MVKSYDYDLIVIGAGSGGTRAARMVASKNVRVAIIEEYRAGGTCVIRGCVPKKLYVYASRFPIEFKLAHSFGFSIVEKDKFDWAKLQENKNTEIARLENIYKNLLTSSGVDFIHDTARFVSPHEIKLLNSNKIISAEKILIATGGKPRKLMINHQEIGVTSNDIFEMPSLPEKIFIYGAGYIGLEFAGILHGLGVDVTIGTRGDKILKDFDTHLVARLVDAYKNKGIKFVSQILHDDFDIRNDNDIFIKKIGQSFSSHQILNTTGRIPNTESLGLDIIGIAFDQNGKLIVNDRFQTNIPSIYALGDVSSSIQLTPVAIAQAMCFYQTHFDNHSKVFNPACIPTAVFTSPEMASVGLTEEQAFEKNIKCKIFETNFRPMKYSLSDIQTRHYIKLIIDANDDTVLGAHLLGNDAGELIQLIAIAITAKLKKHDFDNTLAVHPTISEELVMMRTHTREI